MTARRLVTMVPHRRTARVRWAVRRSHRRGELGANRAERVTDAVTDPRT